MNNPILLNEILDRVAGNREFVLQMLGLFFQSSDTRLANLRRESAACNYPELAEQAHKLEGLASNLSIHKALLILRNLHSEAVKANKPEIDLLLSDLEEAIGEAKAFFQNDPLFKP